MGAFIPREIAENHWHQLKGNATYGIKCDEDSVVHLKFGAGGLFLAVNKGEDNARIVSSINAAEGTLAEISRFGQGKVLVLGRSSECQIRISHPILSRKHIEMAIEGDVLLVKDLGSTNGTFCHSENFFFDIDAYLSKNSPQANPDSTMDEIHEGFGPMIDEILKNYSASKQKG